MKNWKLYEKNLTKFLSKHYPSLMFQTQGGSNSALNDIRVFKEAQLLFAIEAKYLPSQCGQITLVDTKQGFIFSKRSRQKFMPETQAIIKALNIGEILYLNDVRICQWVKAYYLQKNALWFALSQSFSRLSTDNVYLCQTKELSNYVDIKATLRRKKSGSRHLAKKSLKEALARIDKLLPDAKCHSEGFILKRLTIICTKTPKELYLSPTLYLSKKKDLHYEVRQLSHTNNWTVSFSMKLKNQPSKSKTLV